MFDGKQKKARQRHTICEIHEKQNCIFARGFSDSFIVFACVRMSDEIE